jgi:hypothetical protein
MQDSSFSLIGSQTQIAGPVTTLYSIPNQLIGFAIVIDGYTGLQYVEQT